MNAFVKNQCYCWISGWKAFTMTIPYLLLPDKTCDTSSICFTYLCLSHEFSIFMFIRHNSFDFLFSIWLCHIFMSFLFLSLGFLFLYFLYLKYLMNLQCHTSEEIQLGYNKINPDFFFPFLLPFFWSKRETLIAYLSLLCWLFTIYTVLWGNCNLKIIIRQTVNSLSYLTFFCQYKRAFCPKINSIKSSKYNLSSLRFPQCLEDL